MTSTLGDSVSPVALANYNDQAEAGYVGGIWPTYWTLLKMFPAKATAGDLLSIAIAAAEIAQCLDVESGDATIAQAPGWYRMVISAGIIRPWFYIQLSNAQALVNALAAAGIPRNAYVLWIAHYTDSPHLCSPACGFGLQTNADATQWTQFAAGTDQSLVADGIFPLGRKPVYAPTPIPGYVGMARTPSGRGYWMVNSAGLVSPFGDAKALGHPTGLNKPIVGIASHPSSEGYWLAAADGGIFSYGAAPFCGSLGSTPLNKPVVGIAATADGNGYWMVASDGGVFQFGSAKFAGSTGNVHLNAPVIGLGSTPSSKGYWLAAADGGIFNFGDAHYDGSTGNVKLNRPMVGIAATPTGQGYWMTAADGGIFCFGDAGFYGSLGATHLNRPIVGIAATPSGKGYWLSAADGGVFNFGDAAFAGSAA